MSRVQFRFGVLLLMGLCACSSTAPSLMLVVDAEPGVRARTSRIELDVRGVENSLVFGQTYDLAARGLPIRKSFIPRGGDLSRFIVATVSAYEAGSNTPLLVSRIRSGFANGQNEVRVLLLDGCIGQPCSEGNTCVVEAGSPRCVPTPEVIATRDAGVVDSSTASQDAMVDASSSGDAAFRNEISVPGDAIAADGSTLDALVCTPSCQGRMCGADPTCGQSCGSCMGGTCNASGQCEPECVLPTVAFGAPVRVPALDVSPFPFPIITSRRGFGHDLVLSGDGSMLATSFEEDGVSVCGSWRLTNGVWNAVRYSATVFSQRVQCAGVSLARGGQHLAIVYKDVPESSGWTTYNDVYFFSLVNDTWVPYARPIQESFGYYAPRAFQLSSDGSVFVLGYDDASALGRVRVFSRQGDGWSTPVELRRPADVRYFGSKLAVSNDAMTIAVVDNASDGYGRVTIHRRNGMQWTNDATLPRPDGAVHFGSILAISGDGATVAATEGEVESRRVLVFRRFAAGWQLIRSIARPTDAVGGFGADVKLSSDASTLLVGTSSAAAGAGSVFVYDCTASPTSLTAPADTRRFGERVALSDSGERVAVSAQWGDPDDAVYVHSR